MSPPTPSQERFALELGLVGGYVWSTTVLFVAFLPAAQLEGFWVAFLPLPLLLPLPWLAVRPGRAADVVGAGFVAACILVWQVMSHEVFQGLVGAGMVAIGAVGWCAFAVAWLRARSRAALQPVSAAPLGSAAGAPRPNQQPESPLPGSRHLLGVAALGVLLLPLLSLTSRVGLRAVIVQLVMAGGTLAALLVLGTATGRTSWSRPGSTTALLVLLGLAILIGAWFRIFG